jgi:outer membrane receptor protein involved in Fe transport
MALGRTWRLAPLILLLIPADVWATEEEQPTLEELYFDMEELFSDKVEAVSKYSQSVLWSPSAVTTLTKEEIRASGATTLPDLLRRVPGFDIYSVKPSYTLVGARSLTNWNNNLVLLLIDGREEVQELSGFAFWNALTIDLEEIERIEIIRGPGSALYGANAFAAVVSITTVSEWQQDQAEVLVSGGENGVQRQFAKLRGSVDIGKGTLSYGVGAGSEGAWSTSDRRDRFMEMIRAHGYLRYRTPQLDFSLHSGVMSGDFTFMLFAGDLKANDYLTPWVMGKAGFNLSEWCRLKTQVYYSRYKGEMTYRIGLRAMGIWLADIPVVPWDTHTLDGQAQLEVDLLDALFLVTGGSVRYNKLESSAFIMESEDELRTAGFAHLEYRPLDILQLTAGVRLDANTVTDLAVSPRAAVVLRPWSGHSFRLGYGLAFRKPSFFESQVHMVVKNFNPAVPEIVDKLAEEMGNPDLRNMKVHSFEAGWRTSFLENRLTLVLDLFFNLYRDPIDFQAVLPLRLGLPDIRNSSLMYQNDPDGLDSFGGELEATYRSDLDWFVWANLGVRKAYWKEDSRRDQTEPLLRANLGVGRNPRRGLVASASLHYVSTYHKQVVQPDDQVREADYTEMGNDLLLMGRAGYRFERRGDETFEAGCAFRFPLVTPFRETAGARMPDHLRADSRSDFGGEFQVRQLSFYLRGSF